MVLPVHPLSIRPEADTVCRFVQGERRMSTVSSHLLLFALQMYRIGSCSSNIISLASSPPCLSLLTRLMTILWCRSLWIQLLNVALASSGVHALQMALRVQSTSKGLYQAQECGLALVSGLVGTQSSSFWMSTLR